MTDRPAVATVTSSTLCNLYVPYIPYGSAAEAERAIERVAAPRRPMHSQEHTR